MTNDTNNPVVDENNDTKPADNENVVNQTADTGNDTPDSVPYARFNQQTKQVKSLQAQIDKMKSEKKAKAIQETNDLGEAKNIIAEQNKTIEELTAFKTERVEIEQQEHESLLQQIPEDEREIYGKLPLKDLKKIISKQSQRRSVPTDKSSPVRTGLKVQDTDEIWKMSPENKRKNWGNIVSFYKNKK